MEGNPFQKLSGICKCYQAKGKASHFSCRCRHHQGKELESECSIKHYYNPTQLQSAVEDCIMDITLNLKTCFVDLNSLFFNCRSIHIKI